jgi:hypothetical protein
MTVEIITQSSPYPISLFRRIWLTAILVVGLIVTVAWMALLGYGLIKLTEPAIVPGFLMVVKAAGS